MKSKLLLSITGAAAIASFSACNKPAEDAAASTSENTPVLRFSAIPDEDTTAQAQRFQPLADYLSKALEVQVEFVASPNYGASVQKFSGGDIQLAWFGGVTGVQARQAVDGAQAIVAGSADLNFKSYFIAHNSTGLQKSDTFPSDISKLKFTYGSQNSTSGCIMPTHFLMEASGQSPQAFFTQEFGFSGSHDKTLELVANGTFQAGALNFKTYEKAVAAGKVDPASCVVIWETPTYADYNMTAHPVLNEQFGEGFIKKLQQALINCDDQAALNALKRAQLVPVENATFDGIASVMEKVSFK
ncbi:putative selenate ABC transporter substrate-binding protein [Rubritalea marina]|uniref:putative selenate ABC transporter substrate-binding protein n=1 Tax=Rubritalea marina TaxID=361055 RepID=UPI00036D1196|nr:putative selenate ABC transporter substrate-binding protein [Rubritalea marina]